ncbi:MAG: DUF4402 domain-containing protein [Gammaproteobacteria bacterium]|nr:DUF4402 domain-containing protein [Gammaproteobacteria bacterium]
MLRHQTINIFSFITLALLSYGVTAAPPPPNVNQCKTKWVMTSAQSLSFGAFAIESGSGTLMMNNAGVITTVGAISSSTSNPVTTFTVTLDNTKSRTVCGTFPFTISWSAIPAPLAGPGTAMPLTNVLVSEATLIPTPTALPVTLTTNNLPITLTFQGDLSATFPQAAGLYTSPAFTVDFDQSGAILSVISSATATALTPIGIIETVAMNFGTIAGGSQSGTVIMDALGARSVTGDAQILTVGPGAAGEFQITGEPSLTYSLLITGPAILENALGQQITVNGFTNNSLGALPAAGLEIFQVGATINLAPSQPAGTYSTGIGGGTPYSVTVNYN